MVGKPFEWGVTDCGSLAFGALRVMYGQPHPIEGELVYKSQRAAMRIVNTVDILDVVADHATIVSRGFIGTGDIVIGFGCHWGEGGKVPSVYVYVDRKLQFASLQGVGWLEGDDMTTRLRTSLIHRFH